MVYWRVNAQTWNGFFFGFFDERLGGNKGNMKVLIFEGEMIQGFKLGF
jgi:hypothetical protein